MKDDLVSLFLHVFIISFLLIGLPAIFIIETNNFDHKPCEWFVANNYSIGSTPLRCKDNLK